MKKFTSLFVVFFLLSFASISLAAEIKLQDTSSSSEKSIAVSIDTKGELTENVKIVIENSSDVTITDIVESDISCSTFSYLPGTNSEIICTLPSKQAVQGLIAKILFTATSEDYEFTIVKESSKVGDLTIENVTNVGEKIATTTTNETTTEESTPTSNTTTQTPTTRTTTTKETNDIMVYIPYILLGVAGIFLISIIVLLVTKKKDNVVLTDVPASVQPPQPTQPTSQPTQQPVDFENIPQNLQNETMHDNIAQSKPTLAEMINQPTQAPEQTTEQVPTISETPAVPETSPVLSTSNEQADLEELLRSENPSMATSSTSTGGIPDVTSSQQQEVIPPQPTQPTPQIQQEPVQTTVPNDSSTINGQLTNYSANVTEGGLPDIGSTSPLEDVTVDNSTVGIETDNLTSPNLGSTEQPMESVVTQPEETTSSMDADLQNTVNMEINNIPTSVENNIEPEQPTTNENITPPTGI